MVGGAVLVVIVEGRIAADRIEADLRLAVVRGEPGLLDRQRFGRLAPGQS